MVNAHSSPAPEAWHSCSGVAGFNEDCSGESPVIQSRCVLDGLRFEVLRLNIDGPGSWILFAFGHRQPPRLVGAVGQAETSVSPLKELVTSH